jgi:hypothetical protein
MKMDPTIKHGGRLSGLHFGEGTVHLRQDGLLFGAGHYDRDCVYIAFHEVRDVCVERLIEALRDAHPSIFRYKAAVQHVITGSTSSNEASLEGEYTFTIVPNDEAGADAWIAELRQRTPTEPL